MKKQFGRSMIEMLGVLAIIGVLSIGGLLGYRRAVNNHQANTILDDANRLAFVILESNQSLQTNDFMEEDFIDSVPYTGTYNLDAFMAASGQFGIVVTNVPRGVCEALLPKAVIEYKVRVLPDKTADNVQQLSAYGIAYTDSTDICNNANDIVLYFGDTSKQCTNTDTECTSNADCCDGEFCLLSGALGSTGICTNIDLNTVKKLTLSNGQTWITQKSGMYWDNARNWCAALGLTPASRKDLGCDGKVTGDVCNTTIMTELHDAWEPPYETWYWLDQHPYPPSAHTIGLKAKTMSSTGKTAYSLMPLCLDQ